MRNEQAVQGNFDTYSISLDSACSAICHECKRPSQPHNQQKAKLAAASASMLWSMHNRERKQNTS
jgi:hypothetical protein